VGVSLLIGALYAAGTIARGHVVTGLVGGALAAILCVLVLREVEARRRCRRRRLSREPGAGVCAGTSTFV
jgi:hypothetical protein